MSETKYANWHTVFRQDYDGRMWFSEGRRVEGLRIPHGTTELYTDEMTRDVEVTVWTAYGDNSTVEAWRIAKEDYPELTFATPLDDDGNEPEDGDASS